MPAIVVAPLSRIAEAASRTGTRQMVSLMAAGHAVHRPAAISHTDHLRIEMNDIAVETDGLILPAASHVEALLRFVDRWDRTAPLLVHCWMGISRSPAAALLALLHLSPGADPDRVARRLRAASPYATPNARLIEAGDAVLGLGGRLTEAVAAIGRGQETAEGTVFRLALSPADQPDGGQ